MADQNIKLAHGAGGEIMQKLIKDTILKHLANPFNIEVPLEALDDSAVIDDATVRFAEIRDELNASVDEDVLIPLMQEAEQIMADQVVIIPLYARLVTSAVWGDEIGGHKHNPTQAAHTWNIEEWYRVDL